MPIPTPSHFMLPPDVCRTCMESETCNDCRPKTLGDWHRDELPDDWEDEPDAVELMAQEHPDKTSSAWLLLIDRNFLAICRQTGRSRP